MSLTYPQMLHLYHEIKPIVEGAICEGISVSGPASFSIHLRRDSTVYHLLLCFKEPFLRFHLTPKPVVHKTTQIPFVQKLAAHLEGETVLDCSLLNEDRILAFTFKKKGKAYRVVAEFLPRRANCYLMDPLQRIESSLSPVDHLIYDLPMRHVHQAHVNKPIDLLDSHAVAALYDDIEKKADFATRKRQVESEVKKNLLRARKRVEARKETLQECLKWPEVHHEGMLLQSNLFRMKRGDKEIVIADWNQGGKERTIALDPLEEPHDQIELIFKRSRKLKAGKPHAEKQLKIAEDDLAFWTQQQHDLALISTLKGLDDFCQRRGLGEHPKAKAAAAIKVVAKPYHCFKAGSGAEIWVGKSAKDNDKLSFHCANGLDWWLHARNCPGSHVVVRLEKGQELDDETLHDAAELALRHSKDKGQGAGEVTLTQVKFLVPVKGSPGKVMLSKHKTVRVKLDDQRWARLKSQSSSSLKR